MKARAYFTVAPEAAREIPITMILLVLIPVVFLVVILAKLGVISISLGDEEGQFSDEGFRKT